MAPTTKQREFASPFSCDGQDYSGLAEPLSTDPPKRKHLRDHVIAFHRAMGVADPERPTTPSDEVVRHRLRLIAEEFFEALDACANTRGSSAIREARSHVAAVIAGPIFVRLPAFVDALADLDFVIEGSRLACGVDGEPIAAEVLRSNLTKERAVSDAIKIRKGPRYEAPDIAVCLKAQGWSP